MKFLTASMSAFFQQRNPRSHFYPEVSSDSSDVEMSIYFSEKK